MKTEFDDDVKEVKDIRDMSTLSTMSHHISVNKNISEEAKFVQDEFNALM